MNTTEDLFAAADEIKKEEKKRMRALYHYIAGAIAKLVFKNEDSFEKCLTVIVEWTKLNPLPYGPVKQTKRSVCGGPVKQWDTREKRRSVGGGPVKQWDIREKRRGIGTAKRLPSGVEVKSY